MAQALARSRARRGATRVDRRSGGGGSALRPGASRGLGPLHIVSAWASEEGVALGQIATEEKSNEITAIPLLLEQIELTDALITIDAMGCQKEIARTIRGRKADYILALKANHGRLFEQVVAFWDGTCARLRKGPDIGYHREWSRGHGRDEGSPERRPGRVQR